VEPVIPASLEHPLLDALAVRAVVGASLPAVAGWTPLPCEGFDLARNEEALPRVSLAFAGRGVSPEELASRIASSRIDPAREVLWVGEGSLPESDANGSTGTVEVLEDSPQKMVVRCHADREAVLVIADSADPGWRAKIGGRPVPQLDVWGLVRGVRIPPGTSVVEMRYRPRSALVGLSVTALAGVALLASGVALRRRHRRIRLLSRRPSHKAHRSSSPSIMA